MNDAGPGGVPGTHEAQEAQVREVLALLASEVEPAPGAFRRAQRMWRRRERRRRLLTAVVLLAVLAGADALGLWALNRAHSTGVIFTTDTQPPAAPAGGGADQLPQVPLP
ncbi:MAG: hypothetical protein ACTHK1_07810 [Actinomycetales bacterium]